MKPTLTAPVMRFLEVEDVNRSVKFYEQVLGFKETTTSDEYGVEALTELVCGPARLQLISKKGDIQIAPAIVFFETSDVTTWRAEIIEHGGRPTKLEKVNWIKMEMFELRDPDGNILWFGQSYNQPDKVIEHPMLEQTLPHMPVDNVAAAIDHYRDMLGFHINYAQHDLGVMYRDRATLLLIQRTNKHTGIGSFSVYVADADSLYNEFVEKGANVEAPPVSRPWGLRDFTVVDLEGNRITFAQPFE